MSRKVILLKNKTVPVDSYDVQLAQNQLDHVFIPLLKHTHLPNQCLNLLSVEYLCSLDYLIITSQRAVECVQQSILVKLPTSERTSFLSKPVYTVGPATAKFITEVGFTDVRGGIHAGNGSILSDIIISDLKDNQKNNKILFLVGEVRRDIIPKKLEPIENISLEEMVIYKTECLENITETFNHHYSLDSENILVFFSPQGTEYIIPEVQKFKGQHQTKIISIGPTTQQYLSSHLINVDKVCAKPDASSLLDCIKLLV